MKQCALAVLLAWSILGAAGGCRSDDPPTWHEADGYRWRTLDVPRWGGTGFEALDPARTGVDFVNTLTQEDFLANRHYVNGSGVALGDVDGDGRPDLYFAHLGGDNRLYRNLGRMRFEDVTAAAGVAAPDRYATGAVLADVDGDGDLDLLVTALGGPNAAYRNDGRGVFEEVTSQWGLGSSQGSTTMALSDVEGDGDLDLYVANYKVGTVRDRYAPPARSFERTVVESGGTYRVTPEFEPHYKLRIQGNQLMRFEYAEADRFYLNDGTGRFTAVDFTDGRFRDADGQALQQAPTDWALTAQFYDVNGDGAPDLYVANDFESPDHFWLGDGQGGFQQAPRLSLRKTSNATMAVSFSDVDRDGDVDFFLPDMLSADPRRRRMQMNARVPVPAEVGVYDDRPQEMQNALQVNRGDGTFAELGYYAGLSASEWTWSSLFLDVDLDGYEDLLIANGHAYDAMHADTQERIAATPVTADWQRTLLLFPSLSLENLAFRNQGNLRFQRVENAWGLAPQPDVAHGMAAADLDGDGDLDLVTNRLNAPAAIYHNTGTAPRLAVRLRGRPPNTAGVGARVTLHGGAVVQASEVVSGGQYLSGSEALLVFAVPSVGSGAAEAADSSSALALEVCWRSGACTRVAGVQGNRLYEITEPGGGEAVLGVGPASGDSTASVASAAEASVVASPEAASVDEGGWFVQQALGDVHVESRYDDFGVQALLPWRLSRGGPSMAVGDVDGDGAADVLIGGGRGGGLRRYVNESGALTRVPDAVLGAPAEGDHTGMVILQEAQGARVLVGRSGYEAGDTSSVLVYQLTAGAATRLVQRLPLGTDSPGPLALADIDGDHDLDLFVGGRFVPGRYPMPAGSHLFINDEGTFRRDTQRSAAFAGVGLVNGAAFGDMDGDGDLDLVLAQEWGAIRLMHNDGTGQFVDATEAWGLSGYTGLWRSVSLGDFDGDGRLDVAAANWGWNSAYGRPEETGYPLRLYWGDLDRDGRLDMIEAGYEPALAHYAPLRSLSYLSFALPGLRRWLRTYELFAATSAEDLFGSTSVEMHMHAAAYLGSTLFMNRGDRFEARPLPGEAQWSTASATGVGDLDGDGAEDLFLSQNLFTLHVEAGRQDAGRGLWLRGRGDGTFTAVPGRQSGILAYGEQRAAALADFDGDGRTDLILGQNAAETHYYRNRGATPGLRVRLAGPPENPTGVGATVRLVYGDGRQGPARLVAAGSSYRSQSATTQVMGQGGSQATAVWVRWPDGTEQRQPIAGSILEATVSFTNSTAQ